ncbi:MAG: hypothetical protein HY859_14470 [Caulobacterales bacterium]|nr:hypothetical protein [Caulobacterales bacterium]
MRPLLIAAALALLAVPATAQVEVTTLAAPDYFSLGDRTSGIGSDFWLRTSPELAREVIGTVGRKPLSPAFAALGRLAIGAGVPGPEGVGRDPEVAAARVQALLRLGAPQTAWAAVERAPGVGGNLALAEAAAEAALIAGQDDYACKVSDQLTVGRGEIYWLRLRAYCQARTGQADAAQLTFTLAGEKAKDAVYARLMGATLAVVGDHGAASLRNGLDLALSRRLTLDLQAARATASPAVAAALWPAEAAYETEGATVARSLIASAATTPTLIDTLLAEAEAATPKARPILIGRILLLEATGATPTIEARARLAKADAGRSAAGPTLLLALDRAANLGLKGETALIALAIASDAGAAGPAALDRARIVAALRRVGLAADAQTIAIEGLLVPAP